MKVTDKDRSQLLRMAGNIAGGICANPDLVEGLTDEAIAKYSANIALATMQAVDRLLGEGQENDPR